MQTRIGQSSTAARTFFCALLGGVFLVYIWHRNYNLLGDFFDYSILTSACGQLHEGLKPYRDFSTPLQSLTIYLCYASEMVFGHRYLALAYGNLAVGLAFYAICIRLLKDRLPLFLRIFVAAALCIATFFQHGILWYNSLAMMLLTLIVWCCAILYRSPRLRHRDVAALCLLLFLSSMCKINFHLLGLGCAIIILVLRFFRVDPAERKKFVWLLAAIILSGVVIGPITEIVVNGTTLSGFFGNVFKPSADRFGMLSGFLKSDLYVGKFFDSYPDNWSYGVYLISILSYAGCAYLALRRTTESERSRSDTRAATALRLFAPLLLTGFLLDSMLLTLTNVDIQMLTAVFVIAGLVAVFLMFAPEMSHLQNSGFKSGILLLSGYFFVFGSISAWFHSRVRYGEYSWTDAIMQTWDKTKNLSAFNSPLPLYEAASISPRLASGYFQGVRFTGLAHSQMVKVVAFLDKINLADRPQRIYWGPGLQVLNRVYGDMPVGRLPLWYHFDVTVNDTDSQGIINELKRDDYEWIIAIGEWMKEMPIEVRYYIVKHYEQLGGKDIKDLKIYHQEDNATGVDSGTF